MTKLHNAPHPKSRKPFHKASRNKSTKNGNAAYLLTGGCMLALVGLLADVRGVMRPAPPSNVCQEVVQPKAVLSRDQLSRLLTVPERGAKADVQAIVSQPYCRLPEIEARAGVMAQREVYPLAFDPQTWFVVLYEGDEYAGYDFVFQR